MEIESFPNQDDCLRDSVLGNLLSIDRSDEEKSKEIFITNWWDCECKTDFMHDCAKKTSCEKCKATAEFSPESKLSVYLKTFHSTETIETCFDTVLEPQMKQFSSPPKKNVTKPTRYSHAFTLPFEVTTTSSCKTDEDYPSAAELIVALEQRLSKLRSNPEELEQAVGSPFDTHVIHDDG